MLISLNWLRDYVDLPVDLNAHDLAERFTVRTAEVDDVREIKVAASGLIAARIRRIRPLDSDSARKIVELDVGGRTVETVSAASRLPEEACVVFAPPGARVADYGQIETTTVGGHSSNGLILPGEALGIPSLVADAVFLDPSVRPGTSLDSESFDDWLIEVDNKSITHRPDLWGHFGIAREVAAMLGLPLKPMPVVSRAELDWPGEFDIPIQIADPDGCRRYSALMVDGVHGKPAPLWMQCRLGAVGLRPISALVDLTNYVMVDIGQPMHAFDAARVEGITVTRSRPGERFQTLDGVDRMLTGDDLMILSRGRSVAVAGVMGGMDTEVSPSTTALLLESANFDAATVRRTAIRLGLRTDASARFEKSLDPVHTVLAIQRFIRLAKPIFPSLSLRSRLTDVYPRPATPMEVRVAPAHVARTIGRPVPIVETRTVLEPLGFSVAEQADGWRVGVPSFRATRDISIEADVIEEIARTVGYDTIEPVMPAVTLRRLDVNRVHELERRLLRYFTDAHGFFEVHGYIWNDATWLRRLAIDAGPSVTLRNPISPESAGLRRSLLPGLLATTTRNRFHFDELSLVEVGSVFERTTGGDREERRLGLVMGVRGRREEGTLLNRLKRSIESSCWNCLGRPLGFRPAEGTEDQSWISPADSAQLRIGPTRVGWLGTVDPSLRGRMDEHLVSWSIVWAELGLDAIAGLESRRERLGTVPPYPEIEFDASFLVPITERYSVAAGHLRSFQHPLLRRLRFVGSFEGSPIPADRRSLTFRFVLGDLGRTLLDTDTEGFRAALEQYLGQYDYVIRR